MPLRLRQRGGQPLLTVSGCWCWRAAVGGGGGWMRQSTLVGRGEGGA